MYQTILLMFQHQTEKTGVIGLLSRLVHTCMLRIYVAFFLIRRSTRLKYALSKDLNMSLNMFQKKMTICAKTIGFYLAIICLYFLVLWLIIVVAFPNFVIMSPLCVLTSLVFTVAIFLVSPFSEN